jgi:hypothetical protein
MNRIQQAHSNDDGQARDTQVVDSLAAFDSGGLTLAQVKAVLGVDDAELHGVMTDPEVMRRVEVRKAQMAMQGTAQQMAASVGTQRAINRLLEVLDDPDLPPSMVLAIGSFMHKASGIEPKLHAELRTVEPERPKFTVIVGPADTPFPPGYSGIRIVMDRDKRFDSRSTPHPIPTKKEGDDADVIDA